MYRSHGKEFLFKVFESSKCLEQISSIDQIINAVDADVDDLNIPYEYGDESSGDG